MESNLTLTFLILSIAAQAQFFRIKQLRDTTAEGGNLSFPVVESTQRPEVAHRINLYLQLNELRHLLPSASKVFENFSQVTEYSNEIVVNNERVIAFHFSSMTCLAHCDLIETEYVFDARTGNFVTLERLFLPEGLKATRHALLLDWKARVLPLLKDENSGDDYKECVERIEQLSELPIIRFSISDNQLSFWTEQCLGTAERSYDNTRGYFTKSFAELKPYMSAYGKSLFGQGEPPKEPVPLLHTVLRGKIDNKTPVTMILLPGSPTDAPDAIAGLLVYDKDDKPLILGGFVSGNKVTIHEKDKAGVKGWTIEAIWDGLKLVGTIKALKTGGVMAIAVVR